MARRISCKFAVSYLNENRYGAVSPITMCPPILRNRFSKFLWSIAELAGIVPVVLLQVYLPLLLGFTVVAERYVVDSVASIAYFLGDDRFDRTWQARLLLSLVPRKTLFVFIDAHYSTIVSRRGELAGPEDYTNFHRRMFKRLAERVGAVCFDASTQSIDEIHTEILANIRGHFGSTV